MVKVGLVFGKCCNCARGAVTPAMLERKTLLCLPWCFEKWLFTHRKLNEELLKVFRAFVQRSAAVPGLDWSRYTLKRSRP